MDIVVHSQINILTSLENPIYKFKKKSNILDKLFKN